MSFLDPAKLLIILVVALVVLGPDKLPAAARKVNGLLGDFRRWRSMVEDEVRRSVDHLDLPEEVRDAGRALERARIMDPRRSWTGLLGGASTAGSAGSSDDGLAGQDQTVQPRVLQPSRSPERVARSVERAPGPAGPRVPVAPADPGLN